MLDNTTSYNQYFIQKLLLTIIISFVLLFSIGSSQLYANTCLVQLDNYNLNCSAGSACETDPICQCEALIKAGTIDCKAAPCNQHPICSQAPDSDLIGHTSAMIIRYAKCYESICYTKSPTYDNDITYLKNPHYNLDLCNKCHAIKTKICEKYGSINYHAPPTQCNNGTANFLNNAIKAPACNLDGGYNDLKSSEKDCVLNNVASSGCKESVCWDNSNPPFDDLTKYEPNPNYNPAKCTECNGYVALYCQEFGGIGYHGGATLCGNAVNAFLNKIRYAKDTDGDGTADHYDNCPQVPNPSQLDDDNDGYGCACDADEVCAITPKCGFNPYCWGAQPLQNTILNDPTPNTKLNINSSTK